MVSRRHRCSSAWRRYWSSWVVKGNASLHHLLILFVPLTLPSKANELLMAVERLYYGSVLHHSSPSHLSSPFLLFLPLGLFGSHPISLALTPLAFVVCQQISRGEAAGLLKGNYLELRLYFFLLLESSC